MNWSELKRRLALLLCICCPLSMFHTIFHMPQNLYCVKKIHNSISIIKNAIDLEMLHFMLVSISV